MNYNLGKLTDGERLWLWRRCRGDTQEAAAARLGICRTTLHRMEHDRRAVYNGYMGPPAAAVPTPGDYCALARRRSGLGLAATARSMGVSRVTVLAREAVGAPEIVNFWRNQGFRFPKG